MGGGILVDGGPSALDTNSQLRIRYLPKDPPRDGYKNKGKLRWRLALGRAVRKKTDQRKYRVESCLLDFSLSSKVFSPNWRTSSHRIVLIISDRFHEVVRQFDSKGFRGVKQTKKAPDFSEAFYLSGKRDPNYTI